MKFLFNEQVDDYFLQIAELNNNGEKLSIEDYIKEFEKEPDLNIEFLGYESIIGYEFYYLVEYDIPIRIIPCPPNMLIDLLKRNLKLTDEVLFGERDFEDLLILVEKRYYIYLFNNCYWVTDNITKRRAFREAYTLIEDCFNKIRKDIIDDVFLNITEEEKLELDKKLSERGLDEKVIIYRGQNSKSTPLNKAYSWTTDENIAHFFANRFNLKGDVYKANILKNKIRWYFDDRNESEVIVYFDDIEDIEKI